MTHAIFEERVSQFRAMVFEGTEQLAEAKVSVTAAMDRLFGVHPYTTTEGWLVGGIEGNGEVNKSGPDKSPAWWQRIEKARREIQEHKEHILWRDQVDAAHRVWASEDISGLINFIKGQY